MSDLSRQTASMCAYQVERTSVITPASRKAEITRRFLISHYVSAFETDRADDSRGNTINLWKSNAKFN